MIQFLCVTKAEAYAKEFLVDMHNFANDIDGRLVVAADGADAEVRVRQVLPMAKIVKVQSKGYIESVLDEAIEACDSGYILRLDDDEACSEEMKKWLEDEKYHYHDHWKFPRRHFWGSQDTYIKKAPLWPDHQTRLSVKEKSGGRNGVHAGSPFGGGEVAHVCIDHFKFLVKTPEERRRIAAVYDAYQPGYGSGGMLPFQCPEDVWNPVEVERVAGR